MSFHFIGSLTTTLEFVTICSNLPNALCCLLLTHQSNFLNLHVYSIQTVREYAKIFSRGDLLLTDIHTDFYATDSLKNAKRKLNEPSEPCGWKRIKYLFDFIFVDFGFFSLRLYFIMVFEFSVGRSCSNVGSDFLISASSFSTSCRSCVVDFSRPVLGGICWRV